MYASITKRSLAGLTVVAAVALVGPAYAQTPIMKDMMAKADAAWNKVENACSADVKSYCSSVTPGGGRLILCILAHDDKISDKCADTLLDVADNIDLAVSNIARTADVCDEDIAKICANVDAGGGQIAQCLIDNQPKLSSNCRAEVAGFGIGQEFETEPQELAEMVGFVDALAGAA